MSVDLSHERQQVHAYIDQLPAAQLSAVRHLLESMVDPLSRALANAPADDEPVTEAEAAAIRRSEEWFRNHGNGIPMEEVLADFGLSMKDFPLEKDGD